MYKNGTAWSLTIILLFIAALLLVSFHGYRSRVFSAESIAETVDLSEKTFLLWQDKNVKGRILLLFDNYPHMMGLYTYYGAPYQLSSSNFIELGVFQNMIREIYFIVPDNIWEEFRTMEIMHPLRAVPGLERGLFLYNMSGVPIIATTPTSLPHLSERVLVYINGSIVNDADARRLLLQKKISSDIIVLYPGSHKSKETTLSCSVWCSFSLSG